MPKLVRYFTALLGALSPLFADTASADETQYSAATTADFAVMDLRGTTAWAINHFQWLEPDAEALETLIGAAGKGPMRLDLVMEKIVPPYCELRPDPEICDDPGVPVNWMEDVPQTICMEIPTATRTRHKDIPGNIDLLCLQPQSNLLFPGNWTEGTNWPQIHLNQTVTPGKIRYDGSTAIIDLTIIDAIATNLANLSEQGYGAAVIGMSDSDLRDVLGPKLDVFRAGDDDSCTYLQRDLDPHGLGYMVLDGELARVSLYGDELDVATSMVRTVNGLSIGSSKENVLDAFPNQTLVEGEHEYLGPDGLYLTWWQDDTQTHGIRFEIDETDSVIAIHAGNSAITLIEGCA